MRAIRALGRRKTLLPPGVRVALAVSSLLGALALIAGGSLAPAQSPDPQLGPATPPPADDATGQRRGVPGVQLPPGVSRSELIEEGRTLFDDSCASCHGSDARGIEGRAPSLRGVGAASADFYVRTGRMPLADVDDQPRRAESPFSERQIDALVAYVATFGGPPVPEVHPQRGSLSEGFELFSERCQGCHQAVARGGTVTGAVVPDLQVSEPVDVAEALKVGPYLMPHFPNLEPREVDSLARYVTYTGEPVDRGGWGIGHIGPIPEGMVTWLLAVFGLVLVTRLLGERTTS